MKPIAFAVSAVTPNAAKPSVSVGPGAMALTRMPLPASSRASVRVTASTAWRCAVNKAAGARGLCTRFGLCWLLRG